VCTSEMAPANAELPTQQAEGEHDDNVVPVNPEIKERRAPRELNEDIYQLKAPTFMGEKVEQFIQEFNDVMEVAQWPPRVALLKLRMSLIDKAKLYGLGPDINSILASLPARFGISAIDAWARIQKLRHDPHTSLQEHAATVMKLAQIAYSDLPQANCEKYTYDAFVQFVNDLGLHHQFLARGVTTVEGALAEGEAYLLVNHMHKNRGISCQVDIEPSAALTDPNSGPPAPANVEQLTAVSKVAQLTDMLAKLVSVLTLKDPVDTAREPLGHQHNHQAPKTTSAGNAEDLDISRGTAPLFSRG